MLCCFTPKKDHYAPSKYRNFARKCGCWNWWKVVPKNLSSFLFDWNWPFTRNNWFELQSKLSSIKFNSPKILIFNSILVDMTRLKSAFLRRFDKFDNYYLGNYPIWLKFQIKCFFSPVEFFPHCNEFSFLPYAYVSAISVCPVNAPNMYFLWFWNRKETLAIFLTQTRIRTQESYTIRTSQGPVKQVVLTLHPWLQMQNLVKNWPRLYKSNLVQKLKNRAIFPCTSSTFLLGTITESSCGCFLGSNVTYQWFLQFDFSFFFVLQLFLAVLDVCLFYQSSAAQLPTTNSQSEPASFTMCNKDF